MALALLTIGILMVIVGFQDTYKAFGQQLGKDFTGNQSFLIWIAAIMIVGSIGYVKQLQGFSRAFMGLIVLAIFLSNSKGQDLFASFASQLKSGAVPTNNTIGASVPDNGGSGGGSTGGGGGGNILGDFGEAISIGATLFG